MPKSLAYRLFPLELNSSRQISSIIMLYHVMDFREACPDQPLRGLFTSTCSSYRERERERESEVKAEKAILHTCCFGIERNKVSHHHCTER